MDNQKTKAIRGTRHRTMTNETKKKKQKKTHIIFYCGSNDHTKCICCLTSVRQTVNYVEYNIVDHQSSSFDFQ